MYFVYILECSDKTYYTGWTNNLEKRLKAHNSGLGSKYTRGRLPVKLVYCKEYPNKICAQKTEWKIKQFSRKKKMKLIKDGSL